MGFSLLRTQETAASCDLWKGDRLLAWKKALYFQSREYSRFDKDPHNNNKKKNDLRNQKYLLDILRISWRVNSCPLIHERFAQSVFKAGLFELCSRRVTLIYVY